MPLDNEPVDIVDSDDLEFENRETLEPGSVTLKVESIRMNPLGDGGEIRGVAKLDLGGVRQLLSNDLGKAVENLEAHREDAQNLLDTVQRMSEGERQRLQDRIKAMKAIEKSFDKHDSITPEVIAEIPDYLKEDPAIAQCLDLNARMTQQISRVQPLISGTIPTLDSSARLDETVEVGQVHLLSRAVASSSVDRLLGTNCLAQEKFGEDDGIAPMLVSVEVDGLGVKGTLPGGNTYFMDIDYSSHNVQKGLYDLEALDYITGNINRGPENIVIDPETGKVRGVQNDLAFPQMDRGEMLGKDGAPLSPVRNLPRYMHEETARKIESLDPEELRKTLSEVGYPRGGGHGALTKEEIDGSVNRLKEMQQHIQTLRGEGRVVKQFTAKEHEEAVMHQMETSMSEVGKLDIYPNVGVTVKDVAGEHLSSTSKTSYVGSVALEKQVNQKDIALGTGESHSFDSLKGQLNTTGKAVRDVEFEEFVRLTDNLRGQERQLLTSMHTPQFAQLNTRLVELENGIEKLRDPGRLDTLKAIPKGGVDSARRELEQERLGVLQEIHELERSIDERVEQIVEDEKEDLWEVAEYNVDNPQAKLGPKVPQPSEPHYGSFEDFRGKKAVGAGGATGSGRVKVDGQNFQLKGSIAHSGLGRRWKSDGLNHENYGEVIATNVSKALVGDVNRHLIPDVVVRQDEHSHEPKVTSRYLDNGRGDLDDLYRKEIGKLDPKLALLPKDKNGKAPIIDENGKKKKHAYITLDPEKSTSPGVLALKDEAAQDVRRNIALSALMGDHDVNPGNMIDVGGTRVGRIDFGHAFNELITAPGGKMTGGGGVRFEQNRILDFFNREKVSGGKLGGDPSKLWRDYEGVGPSQEMATALREVASSQEALDGLVHAKAQFTDLIAKLEADNTPEARKELEDLTKSLARISKNVGKPVTSTEPGDVVKDVFQNLDTFVREGQQQMTDVANLCEMQARIDTFLRDPANEGKKIPDDLPQEVKDLYENLSQDGSSVKATNGEGLQFMKNSKGEKAVSGDLESYAKARQQVVRLERGEGPALNEIDKLEARKAQLQNNPSAGDHVKAFFKHGSDGIQGEIESLDKKIATLKLAAEQAKQGVTIQDERTQLQILKESSQTLKQEIKDLSSDIGHRRLNNQFKIGNETSELEFAEMQRKLEGLEQAREEVKAAIKKEEGVLSVREKLGIKANPKAPHVVVDAPQQGVEDGGVDLVPEERVGPEVRLDQELPQVKLERSQSVRDLMKPKGPKPQGLDQAPEVGVRPRSFSTK